MFVCFLESGKCLVDNTYEENENNEKNSVDQCSAIESSATSLSNDSISSNSTPIQKPSHSKEQEEHSPYQPNRITEEDE